MKSRIHWARLLQWGAFLLGIGMVVFFCVFYGRTSPPGSEEVESLAAIERAIRRTDMVLPVREDLAGVDTYWLEKGPGPRSSGARGYGMTGEREEQGRIVHWYIGCLERAKQVTDPRREGVELVSYQGREIEVSEPGVDDGAALSAKAEVYLGPYHYSVSLENAIAPDDLPETVETIREEMRAELMGMVERVIDQYETVHA